LGQTIENKVLKSKFNPPRIYTILHIALKFQFKKNKSRWFPERGSECKLWH